jgi:hypothetical protein
LSRLPPALRRRDFALLWVAILVTGFGGQMVVVPVGWQVLRDPATARSTSASSD